MNDFLQHDFPLFFPVVFICLWLAITTLLGWISGWFALMRTFPNRPEQPLRTFSNQSGSLSGVNMRSILRVAVCPSGLRFGLTRLFGPFSRDFLVPWSSITVTRVDKFWGKAAQISLGTPPLGTLTVPAYVADRIARAASEHWPEAGSFPPETPAAAGDPYSW
jgi:hypothetical protein